MSTDVKISSFYKSKIRVLPTLQRVKQDPCYKVVAELSVYLIFQYGS